MADREKQPLPAPSNRTDLPVPVKATINDIARLAGVSKKTVSRIINESPLVREGTRDKVLALMRQVGYVPDPQARGLAFRRSFLIGLVYDNPHAQYIVDIQNGALDVLRGSGFELVVHPCDGRSANLVDGILRFARQQKLHGVILLPPLSESPAIADAMRSIHCRCAFIASIRLDGDVSMIVSNERAAAAEVADHLASLGHSEIGLITGPSDHRSSHERRAGFVDALARHGIVLAPERIVEGSYTFESGVTGAEVLLSQIPRPSAIFACNDEMAAGAYRTAHRRDLKIPGQIAIVGYDDSPLAARLCPPLTTVRVATRDIGRHAAVLLLDELPSGVSAPTIVVTPRLVTRESCRPPIG
ncbi:MAG: LacI family DNA-binding transcriptional regulator [Xanthomonadales bacterium]|nr:LacI family DNA-binding transcriptional regulator [Xanthomonadales bacterium]